MNHLEDILQKIRPLNIHEIIRLFEKVREVGNRIYYKDDILPLGVTGSGKCTTIHFLSGTKLVVKDYEIEPGRIIKYISTDEFQRIAEKKS